MNNKISEKIKLWGIVQGVGFRPFVVRLADYYGIKGQVLNVGGLVEIQLTDTEENIEKFIDALKKEKPEPAEIVHVKRERIEFVQYEGFTILDSNEGDDEAAMIPADLAICPECLKELKDKTNSRYQHPFISCMVCGPRYTIIDRIPYDRENTAMIEFPMCEFCHEQYADRNDRRFHAQTISCYDCGPQLESLRLRHTDVQEHKEFNLVEKMQNQRILIDSAADLLLQGAIIGFKCVGGYNLVCNPLDDSAVEKLRILKGREEKPFAIMFKDLEMVRKYCQVSPEEESLITSSARPILLLEKPEKSGKSARAEWRTNLAGRADCKEFEKSRFIGSFLPSMGGQYLLLEKFDGPLIMTSANVSSLPMIKDDQEMLDFMKKSNGLISEVISNKREIKLRVDDSVARVIDGQPQMIRRSKGYTPVPLYINMEEKRPGKETMILATGGQLKNSFAVSKGPFSYVSQYFGDLDSLENCNIYEDNIESMKTLFRVEPCLVACDLHPLYNSTIIGKKYAKKHGIPVLEIQHHHAHIASVMAEHGINDAVIGVSFDGTGYGADGKIWGGEILFCRKERVERLSHLKYVKMVGGDSSMKEGWKSAICYLNQDAKMLEEDEFEIDISEIVNYNAKTDGIKSENGPIIKAALDYNINTIESSSMGRLFDAVSSMLGICQENDYEGKCAILLEDAAARAMKVPGASLTDDLALKFHIHVAGTVIEQCEKFRIKTGVNKVALTGGVFQNKILMEECLQLLRASKFEVFYNISVSPNDGGIALGQNYIAMHYLMSSV
ncbi:MAG TPA: carbamoyltransferase HypF [Anaerovoracaceae bacterium]|nr:carbamoyltransferase HypF [Anaerovoracaceae bacterium]